MSAMSLMFFIYIWLYFSGFYTLTIPSAASLVHRTKVLFRVALVQGRSLRQVQCVMNAAVLDCDSDWY
jgi:hypothetical protein